MPGLIDTHAHLDDPQFNEDRDEVIGRAFQEGLEEIVTVGTEPESWTRAWDIHQTHPRIHPVMGFHPNKLPENLDGVWAERTQWLKEHRPVAIGEIGLDYYWNKAPKEVQAEAFRRQIRLAHEMRLPIVIHCRDAYADCLAILHEESPDGQAGVFHCFAGKAADADQALDLGLYLSFGGPLTYKKNDALREFASRAPLDRILVETDCPYLAPQAVRGKRNEPAYVRFTAGCLAGIRKMSLDELAGATTENARRIFQL